MALCKKTQQIKNIIQKNRTSENLIHATKMYLIDLELILKTWSIFSHYLLFFFIWTEEKKLNNNLNFKIFLSE